MKAGWEASTLGEICEIISGAGFPKKHQGEVAGEFPFFKVGDMNSEGNETNLVAANHYISEETRKKLGARILPSESIVFPKVGGAISTNKKRRLVSPSCVDNNVMGLAPNKEKVNPVYLAWWMDGVDIYEFSNKAALPSITKATVSGWPFPLPPLEEQKRIVAVLDGAFEGLDRARTHIQTNLQNARELFEAQLAAAFDERPPHWSVRKLKDITTKIGSGATPKGGAAAYKSEGTSLIRSLNVHDRAFKTKALAFIDDKQAEALKNVVVEANDVLLNITGASVARCCLAPAEFVPARVNQHVAIIRPETSILLPQFLEKLLTSRPYKDDLLKTGEDNGSTRQALTKGIIQNLEVAYPSDNEEQANIVADLQGAEVQTRSLQSHYLAKLADLDDLRQSLLQKAFAGELT